MRGNSEYRVRKSKDGLSFIPERKVFGYGVISFWWPIGEWTSDRREAIKKMKIVKKSRQPMSDAYFKK